MYSTNILHQVIGEELGQAANWELNNVPIDILIPVKRVTDGMPIYFVKDRYDNACQYGSLKLVDCVTASAAAPTYFYSWDIALSNPLVGGTYVD